MKCMICGSENQDGAAICGTCGAQLGQVAQQPPQQPQQNNVGYQQPQQMAQQPQQMPQQPQQPSYGQTGMQDMGAAQPAYGQSGMQNMTGYQQPMGGYGQPGMQNMTGYQQPMGGYGQPGMQNMTGYQQPYGAPPKPKKPLSKGAKIGIISGLAVALLVGIFFIFIFPILTRAKLGGLYSNKGSYYSEYYLFDDGIWTYYYVYEGEPEKYYDYIGTYTIKDNKIQLTAVDGYTAELKFDEKENTVSEYSTTYKSSDKKAKLEVDLDKEYLDNLQTNINLAAQTALGNEDAYEEAIRWGSYYIYGTDLKEPSTEFEKELARCLDYSNDKRLQFLLENDIVDFYIYVTSSGSVTVEFY